MGKKYTNSWFFVFLVSVFFGANAFAAEDIVTITYAFATNNVSGIEVGGIVPAPTTCAKGQICELTPMDMTDFYRGGHKLIGWGTTNNGTSTTAEYTTTGTFDKDTTLYAVWEPCGGNTYHPDAAGMPANVCETCVYGSKASISRDRTQCAACAKGFTGVECKDKCPNVANVSNQTDAWIASTWNSDNTVSYKCSALRCYSGYSITGDTDEYDPDADSNGTCEPITRELKFSLAAANATWADPTDADKTIEITFNGTLPELPLAQPSRNGYTFKGWWGDSESNLFGSRGVLVYDENGNPINEVLNNSKKFYDIIINRELSAKWEPNPVTITYSAGNFDLIGTLPQPTTCYYEQYCELAPLGTTFNRRGGGWWAPNWYDAEDKSATYKKYGTFTKDTTLIPNFGAFCSQRRFIPGVVGVPVDRCQICASGSYDNSDGASSGCIACAGGTTGDSIYYSDKPPRYCPETCPNSDGVESWATPEWSYTIDADAIDMSAEDPYANVVTNKVTNKCTIDTCKSGYKRVGSYDPDAESNYACVQDMGDTYFDIEYDYAGGYLSTAIEVVAQCNMDSDEITLPTGLIRAGYTFAGWDNNGETVTTIPAGECNNNISLTAQWTPKTYTVTLDKNGGIGSADTSVKCLFDNGCLLPSTGLLQREGYETQNKWCENADGSGSCYTAGQTTDLNISYDATDTTLYAAWEPVIVAIKLIADNAATNQEQTVYMKYADGWYSDEDAKKAISSIGVTAIPTRPGYEFMGFQYDGTIIVDSNGKLLNKPTFTTHDIDATVIWEKSELKCAPGTEPDDNEEYCVPCQNGFDALGNVTVSSWTQGCIIASCMYQGELYDLRNNECVQICPYYTYTDGTGSMIWNNKTKQCERNCIEGFIHW